MSVEVIIEDDRWGKAGLQTLAYQAVAGVLQHLGLGPGDYEISLLACDDARIAALNSEFREKPSATNVLSWPTRDRAAPGDGETPPRPAPGEELGDIAIAYETCAREAQEAAKPLENHVLHLIVHGTLHLLGYDHERDADADLMEATETAILCRLGVPDPYRG